MIFGLSFTKISSEGKTKLVLKKKVKFTPHVNFALISNTQRKMNFGKFWIFPPRSPWAQASCGNGVLDLGLVTLAAHGAAMPTWALSPRRHKLLTPPLTNTLTLTHSKTLSFLTNRMVQNMAEVNLGANSSLAGRIYVFRPSLRSVHQAWSRTLALGICMLTEKKSPKPISKQQKVSY